MKPKQPPPPKDNWPFPTKPPSYDGTKPKFNPENYESDALL